MIPGTIAALKLLAQSDRARVTPGTSVPPTSRRPDTHPAQADKIAAVITTLRRVQAELAADEEADA
jgi:hypothetical protein